MAMIQNDWLEPLNPEFRKPYYAELFQFVKEEYATRKVFPPADDIFNAFHLTPLSQVKVVILGQDPYHADGAGASGQFPQRKGLGGIYGCGHPHPQ